MQERVEGVTKLPYTKLVCSLPPLFAWRTCAGLFPDPTRRVHTKSETRRPSPRRRSFVGSPGSLPKLYTVIMNQLDQIDTMTAPAHGSRRRSSALAAQVLAAIRETDEEIFAENLHFDFVALGAGVAAGYWANVSSKTRVPYKTAVWCLWCVVKIIRPFTANVFYDMTVPSHVCVYVLCRAPVAYRYVNSLHLCTYPTHLDGVPFSRPRRLSQVHWPQAGAQLLS